MPSPLALDSLKVLSRGPQGRRVLPTEDYGFSGAVPTQGELDSPWERQNARMAAEADARDADAVHDVQDTNAAITTYNRPDVTAMRKQTQDDALKKLLLPIQMKGQYDVETAKQQQLGQVARDERLFGNRMAAQNDNQAALDARAAANAKATALRQNRTSLVSRLTKASGSGLGNLFGLTGPSQKDQLTAQLAALDAQLTGMGESGGDAAPEAPPNRMTRKLKNGGVAYSDDGGRTWLQD